MTTWNNNMGDGKDWNHQYQSSIFITTKSGHEFDISCQQSELDALRNSFASKSENAIRNHWAKTLVFSYSTTYYIQASKINGFIHYGRNILNVVGKAIEIGLDGGSSIAVYVNDTVYRSLKDLLVPRNQKTVAINMDCLPVYSATRMISSGDPRIENKSVQWGSSVVFDGTCKDSTGDARVCQVAFRKDDIVYIRFHKQNDT